MEKIAFVGMERMGKSTLINKVAAELSNLNVSYLLLPEVTMKPNNLIKDLDNPEIQLSLIFEQMSEELLYSTNNYKDVVLVDRTPIETLMYMEHILNKRKVDYTIYAQARQMIKAWMSTYETIYYVTSSDIDLKVNEHFTSKDIVERKSRELLLHSYLHLIKHVSVAITKDDKYLAELIAKEIRKTINGD